MGVAKVDESFNILKRWDRSHKPSGEESTPRADLSKANQNG
jgi:hypothetical protein